MVDYLKATWETDHYVFIMQDFRVLVSIPSYLKVIWLEMNGFSYAPGAHFSYDSKYAIGTTS